MSERDELGRARDIKDFCYKKITYLFGVNKEKRYWYGSVKNLLHTEQERTTIQILKIETL